MGRSVHSARRTVAHLILLACASIVPPQAARAQQFERLRALQDTEGVFAYARISPDGRYLAYASEPRGSPITGNAGMPLIKVIDVRSAAVLFEEPGIDAYWSPNGERFVYENREQNQAHVNIHNVVTGQTVHDIVPPSVGDYYSWGVRNGKELILTITSHYFYLVGDMAQRPVALVGPCDGIGVGARPLLSHDGTQITTFVRGTIVVRDLTDCRNIIDTGVRGAKADFSWDRRYIAFHAPKSTGLGYDIYVVDLKDKTIRTITNFKGSSFFPSWTRDGRICFRYDGDDYRGFELASRVLDAPPRRLATHTPTPPAALQWKDIFPETRQPKTQLDLVMIWAPWSAHSPAALGQLQLAKDSLVRNHLSVSVMITTDPASRADDVREMLEADGITLQTIPLGIAHFSQTQGENQIPAFLLFRNGRLVDRRLGAQQVQSLIEWVASAASVVP
jgi:hypothetical protein